MKFSMFLFSTILAIAPLATSQAETMFDRAKDNLAKELRRDYLPVVLEQLNASGRPQWENELKADALIVGYADCVISAIKVSRSSVASEYVQILASGYTPTEIERYFGYLPESERREEIERLGEPVQLCTERVDRELHLLRLSDGTILSW